MNGVKVVTCESEEHQEQYAHFVNRYRRDLYPWADFKDFTALQCHYFLNGHIGVGLNEFGEMIGAFVFCIGTPHEQYRNTDAAYVNICLLREDYRNRFTYLLGMTEVAERIARSGYDVKNVYFMARKENALLQKMYAKFADKFDGISDDHYQGFRVELGVMLDYCRRFGQLIGR